MMIYSQLNGRIKKFRTTNQPYGSHIEKKQTTNSWITVLHQWQTLIVSDVQHLRSPGFPKSSDGWFGFHVCVSVWKERARTYEGMYRSFPSFVSSQFNVEKIELWKKEHLIRDSRGRSKVDRRIQGLIRLADRSPASYIAQIHGCMISVCYITCIYIWCIMV
jgi:hypothetical protein